MLFIPRQETHSYIVFFCILTFDTTSPDYVLDANASLVTVKRVFLDSINLVTYTVLSHVSHSDSPDMK